MAKVSKLDPSADDFNDQITEAVNAAVEANQAFKVAPQFARSSGTEVGGNRNAPPLTQQIADATKAGNHRLAIALKQQLHATTT